MRISSLGLGSLNIDASRVCQPEGAARVRRSERPRIHMARLARLRQAATGAIAQTIRDCRGRHVARHESGDAVLGSNHAGRVGGNARCARRWRSIASDGGPRERKRGAPPSARPSSGGHLKSQLPAASAKGRLGLRLQPAIQHKHWTPCGPSESHNAKAWHEMGTYRIADKCDELAPFHSITSLAAETKSGGSASPRAFAARRLMTKSNCELALMGRSPGLAPRRIRST
jgi:hypothetical protein